MSAKAFAYATGCALIAVDTFAAIALQTPAEAAAVDVLADAQQDNIYVQRFTCGAAPTPTTELAIRPFAEWLKTRPDDAWLTGPGLAKRASDCRPSAASSHRRWDPTADSLHRLGLPATSPESRDDVWKLEPFTCDRVPRRRSGRHWGSELSVVSCQSPVVQLSVTTACRSPTNWQLTTDN